MKTTTMKTTTTKPRAKRLTSAQKEHAEWVARRAEEDALITPETDISDVDLTGRVVQMRGGPALGLARCTGGFGCSPKSLGRAVFIATPDGEGRWDRSDVLRLATPEEVGIFEGKMKAKVKADAAAAAARKVAAAAPQLLAALLGLMQAIDSSNVVEAGYTVLAEQRAAAQAALEAALGD